MGAALAAVEADRAAAPVGATVEALEADLEALARKRFVSAFEAALLSEHHIETVREALRSGELHGAQRVKGGTWKIRPACVDAWMAGEECEHQSAEQPVSLNAWRRRA